MAIETRIEMLLNPAMEFPLGDYELHDLLIGKPEPEARFWNFDRVGLVSFANKISKLYAVSNGGFTFQATWSGDTATAVEYLSIEKFVEIIKNNKIGKQTKYIVAGSN